MFGARLVMASAVLAMAFGAAAQQPAEQPKVTVFTPAGEDPALPRVLLIGDSISIGYTLNVREYLAGKANVQRIPENGGPTTRGLKNIDAWLGDKPWDLIHFNWGLHDLKYIVREEGEKPNLEGGQQVPPEAYVKNLDTLVKRLKQTGAKLIWAATTPVPEGAAGRIPGDSKVFNAAALKVMKKHGVPVNDLYAHIFPHLAKYQREADVHFFPEGSAFLGRKVADEILAALDRK